MRIVTYADSFQQVDELAKLGALEVILSHKMLSRFGTLNTEQLNELACYAKDKNLKCVLEWDALMVLDTFNMCEKTIQNIQMNLFTSVRVQDPGAIEYIKEHYPQSKIQLILETGNHNLVGIKKWISYVGAMLDRVVLSIELSKDSLQDYAKELDVSIEILGLGRILLFYTPRKLVTPLYDDGETNTVSVNSMPLEVSGSSEESPHKGFPIVENFHGTFMFNTKDHCLLENFDELLSMGIEFVRIDLRHKDQDEFLPGIFALGENYSKEQATSLKVSYGQPVIRGFYNINKSDVLFKKLKNSRIQRHDESYLGEVLEVSKKNHIGIFLRTKVTKNDVVCFKTPDGKEKTLTLTTLRNSSGEEVAQANPGELVFVKHIGGISVKSAVYLS